MFTGNITANCETFHNVIGDFFFSFYKLIEDVIRGHGLYLAVVVEIPSLGLDVADSLLNITLCISSNRGTILEKTSHKGVSGTYNQME